MKNIIGNKKLTFVVLLFLFVPNFVFAYSFTKSPLFNGSSQFLSITSLAPANLTTSFTLEAWVYSTLAQNGTFQTIFEQGDYAIAGGPRFGLASGNDGSNNVLRLYVSNGSSISVLSEPTTLSIDTWYHIAVVYTLASGAADFFVNGSTIGTATGGPTTLGENGTAPVLLGTAYNSSAGETEFWNGNISLARIWATTRTGTQLSSNWCSQLGVTTSLNAEWSLDNVLTDDSGNSNTLTNNGTVTFPSTVPSPAGCAAPATPPLPILNWFNWGGW